MKSEMVKKQKSEMVDSGGSTPADMIRMAVAGGADLDKLEKLLSLQERWDANQAKKMYSDSFAAAQAQIESVVKTKLNPQTHSKYAGLENIIEGAKPIYTKEGFAVIFYEGDSIPEHVRIYADVLHRAGHKETYHYDVPIDGVGLKGNANMTKIHAKASSTSYGRRYLMCMIWNIPTGDDNDGNNAQAPKVSKEQLSALRDALIEIGDEKNEGAISKHFKVESFEDLPVSEYQSVMSIIKARKEAKQKAGVK